MSGEMEILVKCILATALGGLIGLERSFHGRAAGVRTHSYVCLGATLSVIVSVIVRDSLPVDVPGDVFRIPAQVVSGIGFLGVGTIFVQHDKVIGLTTAAGIWTTAMVGIAIGYGCYGAAMVVGMLMVILNVFMADVRKGKYQIRRFYFEVDCPEVGNEICDKILKLGGVDAEARIIPAKSATPGYLGISAVLYKDLDITPQLRKMEHVVVAVMD